MLVSKKKYNESVKYVVESYNEEREEEKETLNYIIEKKGSPLNCMWLLGRLHAITASKNLLVDKDVESFKKNMYVFAKLSILGKESRNFLGWDRVSFWGIIMSNNPVLLEFIEKYINIIAYEREGYKYKKSEANCYLTRTILLAIKGDWEKVIERSDIYLVNPSKEPYYKYTYLEFEFLKALAKKDIDKMKESINSMLDIKIARKMLYDMENYFDFYLQIFALIYLKIALHHGIDLGIDSDIAPKELIDNTPADSYSEPYDFMKDFDFKTITAEEWKAWIYRYHKNPEKLKKEEEEGYFI
ncbi:Imm49 family immunity protein [Fusobacterium animalis]|uniref:Imm49 family immunity protein n=1 Tax=Fusobacterium animalis TaxID=76859 RepID=UPI0030CBC21B